MPRRALLACLLVVALAGCGQSSDNVQGLAIAQADVDRVLEAEESVQTACGYIRDQEGSDVPVPQAVDTLIPLLEEDPEGVVTAGVNTIPRNISTIVFELARELETCPRPNPAQARRLREAYERFGVEQ